MAVVKPKQGLFIEEISSLLVICTPVSVLLIALSSSPVPGAKRKEIKLYATDFTVATDIEMTSVVGTAEGRIFMAGSQDGNLYELHYQENESWFGKRVQLINHSVGGVQSLLPRFASSNIDGMPFVPPTNRHPIFMFRSYLIGRFRSLKKLLLYPQYKKQHFYLPAGRR